MLLSNLVWGGGRGDFVRVLWLWLVCRCRVGSTMHFASLNGT